MTKLNWERPGNKISVLNTEYYTDPKKGFDRAWHKQRDKLKQNLSIHKEHDWELINEPTGPHVGKVVCNTCRNKKGKSMFVLWLPKDYILPNT